LPDAPLAIVRDYWELVTALKARMHELGVTMETVDHVAGLPARYTSKIFAPHPIKGLGRISMGPTLGALGVKLLLVEDAEQLARVKSRLVKRKQRGLMPSMMPSVALTPEFMRQIGRKGGLARLVTMQPWQRSLSAREAAKARWQKHSAASG
jgi:hypothetical protein